MPQARNWNSDFAKALKEHRQTRSVETAVIQLIEEKLACLTNLTPPIDLSIVASLCGIRPPITEAEMSSDGRLIYQNSQYRIEVNSSHSYKRQRFTTAHEICHKLLAKHIKPGTKVCSEVGHYIEKQEEEWLCDFGARNLLLLNNHHLMPILNQYGFSYVAIAELETHFDVSFEVAVRSLVEIAQSEIAVMFLVWEYRKDEKIKGLTLPLFPDFAQPQAKLRIARRYTSNSFPLFLPLNKSIIHESRIYDAFDSQERITAREIHSFDDKSHFCLDIEAIPRTIYIANMPQPGVVVLLSNPSPDQHP